jgi:hypothetical protein
MHEWQKGEKSFWFPWLDTLPEYSFFDYWDNDFLLETQDRSVIKEGLFNR